MRRSITTIVAAAAVGALPACRPKVRDLPICPQMVAAERASEADTQTLPVDVWFSVLVKNFNRMSMEPPDEPRECSNQPIEVVWPESMKDDPRAQARKLDRRARTENDITFTQGEDGDLLVWARIQELGNGDAIGPVALVRWVDRGLEVRGIGTVQAPAERARLRLEPLGEDARVLVLESETCPKDKDKKLPCVREAQLLPLVEQRFLSAPMIEDGVDVGPARFQLNDHFEETLKDGWIRRYELQRKLDFVDGVPIVDENIRTRDCDPKSPATPCEERIAAAERRPLVFRDGTFVTPRSAWKQVKVERTAQVPEGE
ncbi:MAG TPA: hypothetical protein VIK91_12720 [Nannocystis sp.]